MSEILGTYKTLFLIVVILIVSIYILATLYATLTRSYRLFKNKHIPFKQAMVQTISQGILQIIFLGVAVGLDILAMYFLSVE